jgi:predicted ABC-type transport system involved in lysophospholipase L1 biosynthesis ATPase subunit
VKLPLNLTNLKKAERIEYATTALKLGLGDRLHHLPRQFSSGQEEHGAIVRHRLPARH